jgi:hypothetical protein
VRGFAGAAALALALGGCGTETWLLFPLDLDASIPPIDQGITPVDANAEPGPKVECTQESDCMQLGQHCDVPHGVCVDCNVNADCKQKTQLPWCSPTQHLCMSCLSGVPETCGPGQVCLGNEHCFYPCPDGGGCPDVAPFCNTGQGRFVCASCRNNGDCADAAVPSFCDTMEGACRVLMDQTVVRPTVTDGGASPDSGDAALDVEMPDVADAGD